MRDERWSVMGLAHPRSTWFAEVASWANSSIVPIEFAKCLSGAEVRARLDSGRRYSALLVGADVTALDRDLTESARELGVAVIVVGRLGRDLSSLGVTTLPLDFDQERLMTVLSDVAEPMASQEALGFEEAPEPEPGRAGCLIAVTGAGGAGSSVLTMALAQGLSSRASNRGMVLLADFSLYADQGLLHDSRALIPGVQELVEAHRGPKIASEEVRRLTFDVKHRGYHLLLGLRRHHDWTALRPRAFEAGLEGLMRSYMTVVADVDPDTEGERETGSLDVEDRNLMARTVLHRADLVLVVGNDGIKGIHSLVRTLEDVHGCGVEAERIVPVLNRMPRSPRVRARAVAAIAQLLEPRPLSTAAGNPVIVPERRELEAALVDGAMLPEPLHRPVVAEVVHRTERLALRTADAGPPEQVVPGSLGRWTEGAA